MNIRIATDEDFPAIWPIFQEIVQKGDTYGLPTDISKTAAQVVWMKTPLHTYVAVIDDEILGSYTLKTNHDGPGSHVCNCGYMVSAKARGLGLATAMCKHSQAQAIALGYQAMQFNFVASSNTSAVGLWKKLGFEIVGTLPKAFRHPNLGLVDAFVMHKSLTD